jgi:hypothetical protein
VLQGKGNNMNTFKEYLEANKSTKKISTDSTEKLINSLSTRVEKLKQPSKIVESWFKDNISKKIRINFETSGPYDGNSETIYIIKQDEKRFTDKQWIKIEEFIDTWDKNNSEIEVDSYDSIGLIVTFKKGK